MALILTLRRFLIIIVMNGHWQLAAGYYFDQRPGNSSVLSWQSLVLILCIFHLLIRECWAHEGEQQKMQACQVVSSSCPSESNSLLIQGLGTACGWGLSLRWISNSFSPFFMPTSQCLWDQYASQLVWQGETWPGWDDSFTQSKEAVLRKREIRFLRVKVTISP